jgi:hypothetical protein
LSSTEILVSLGSLGCSTSGNRYFDWIGFIYLPIIFNSGLLDCKFFDWVQDNKISFQNYFSRLPMTDSLADWARNNPKPSKDGWLKLSPSMFIAKSTRSLSFSPSVVLLTLVSNCTWAKVLENLTVSKLNIFSSFIQPLSFLSDLFYSLF